MAGMDIDPDLLVNVTCSDPPADSSKPFTALQNLCSTSQDIKNSITASLGKTCFSEVKTSQFSGQGNCKITKAFLADKLFVLINLIDAVDPLTNSHPPTLNDTGCDQQTAGNFATYLSEIKDKLDNYCNIMQSGQQNLDKMFKVMSDLVSSTNTAPILNNSPPMAPNTESPHLSRQTAPDIPHFPGKHYDVHQHNFLSDDLKHQITTFISENNENFSKINQREVLYYGEFNYKYTGVEHKATQIPGVIQQAIDQIHENFPTGQKINSCLITKYVDEKSNCPPHGDNSPFNGPLSNIYTLSIGAERTMKFTSCTKYTNTIDENVRLKDNDLLVFSRTSQDFFNHSIIEEESPTQTRYSLTFRTLVPYNLNYTKIIGDSNTQNIVFGPDQGKLGKWMPGARIKAATINDIPDPHSIGPCRNVLLHVGINDVQANNPKSAADLSNTMENKIKSILSVYPQTKILISLLLPTKSASLNMRVNELNNAYKKLAFNHPNIDIVEHNNLTDSNGYLDANLGRFSNGVPNFNYHVHLGNTEIKRFVLNIK